MASAEAVLFVNASYILKEAFFDIAYNIKINNPESFKEIQVQYNYLLLI